MPQNSCTTLETRYFSCESKWTAVVRNFHNTKCTEVCVAPKAIRQMTGRVDLPLLVCIALTAWQVRNHLIICSLHHLWLAPISTAAHSAPQVSRVWYWSRSRVDCSADWLWVRVAEYQWCAATHINGPACDGRYARLHTYIHSSSISLEVKQNRSGACIYPHTPYWLLIRGSPDVWAALLNGQFPQVRAPPCTRESQLLSWQPKGIFAFMQVLGFHN